MKITFLHRLDVKHICPYLLNHFVLFSHNTNDEYKCFITCKYTILINSILLKSGKCIFSIYLCMERLVISFNFPPRKSCSLNINVFLSLGKMFTKSFKRESHNISTIVTMKKPIQTNVLRVLFKEV